jgi:beta-phosphoglucomutase
MIKGMIFDLDGVLVTTDTYHYEAWKRLADELNIPFTIEDNERLKGISRMDSLEIILSLDQKTYSEEEKQAFAKRKNDWYVASIKEMNKDAILPGAEDFLKAAQAKGLKIALGSASKNAPTILERLNLTHYFDAIIDGNSVSKAKPDPEVFLKGTEALELSPEECIVFEDAKAGVEAANAGGMTAIAIGKEVDLPGAKAYYEGLKDVDLENLLALLGNN